jgi:squalene-hopene/tetraprenyl-beta-curcumene cyclase
MTDTTLTPPSPALNKLDALEEHIRAASDAILAEQRPDGHWVFELEADATIPAEYVLMVHYFAESPNLELERKIGVYLRRIQGAHGGWPLFHEGDFDMSASVKAYFALKMIGAAASSRTCSRARCSRSLAYCAGTACRSCRSRSCCCRSGFRSTSTRFRIGRAP